MSKEDEALKHGVFTYYLLEGLKTHAADTDKDGLVDIEELYEYAHSKIKGRYPQNPKRSVKCEGKIIIGKYPEIIKEREYKEKRENLFEKRDKLPNDLFIQAMNILFKDYKDPSSLTDIEKEIKQYLELLLMDEIRITAYIRFVVAILSSKARKLFEEKKYAEAIAKWQEVLKLDPENREAIEGIKESERTLEEIDEKKRKIEELNTSAQHLYNEGKYHEAIDKWKEVLNLYSENQTAKEGIKSGEGKIKEKITELGLQAQDLFEEKRYGEARVKWEKVLDFDPENHKALAGIKEVARILEEVEQKKRKIDELNTSAQRLYDEGKYQEACDTWKEVLNLDSVNQRAIDSIKKAKRGSIKEKISKLSSQAKELFEGMRYAEAIEKWHEVLKLDSENREAIEGIAKAEHLKEIEELNTSAQQLYDEGKYHEAIDMWNEVLNLDPENHTAEEGIKKAKEEEKEKRISELSSQAKELFEEKRYEEAKEKWEEVVELDPQNREAIEGIAKAEHLKQIEELNTLAQQQYKEGKYRVAIDTWKDVLNLDPENQTAEEGIKKAKEEEEKKKRISELSSQAQNLFEGMRYAEAIEKWRKVLKLDSGNLKAIEGIAKAEHLKEIEELNTSAQQLCDEGKYHEAIDKWNEVLNLDPENQTAKEGIKKLVKKYCPNCRHPNTDRLKYCTQCGAKLFEEKLKEKEREVKVEEIKEEEKLQVKENCPKCGYPNEHRLKYCTQCGTNLEFNSRELTYIS